MRLETRYRRPDGRRRPVAAARPRRTPTRSRWPAHRCRPTTLEAELVAACWTRRRRRPDDRRRRGRVRARSPPPSADRGRRTCCAPSPSCPTATASSPTGSFASPERPPQRVPRRAARRAAAVGRLGRRPAGCSASCDPGPSADRRAGRPRRRAMADLRPDQVPELWWTSYAAAERVGLATEVELPGGPHLDVLLVTGLSDLDPPRRVRRPRGPRRPRRRRPDEPEQHGRRAARRRPRPRPGDVARGRPGQRQRHGRRPVGRPHRRAAARRRPRRRHRPARRGRRRSSTALWPVLWQRWLKDVEHAASGLRARRLGGARALAARAVPGAARRHRCPTACCPAVDPAAWKPGAARPGVGGGDHVVATRVLPSWAAAGAAGGTAAGATPAQLLDVIGRVPTSRDARLAPVRRRSRRWPCSRRSSTGSPPARGRRRVGGDGRTVARRRAAARTAATRRSGGSQPGVRGRGSVREFARALPRRAGRVRCAYGARRELEEDPPLLVRLLRHSLLLTMAEASRLDEDFADVDGAVRDPAARRRAAGAGRRVRQPRARAARRGADAARPSTRPTPRPSRSRASSATCARPCARSPATTTHCCPEGRWPRRWRRSSTRRATASTRGSPPLATRRLRRLIGRGVPRRIGAYGWVDDLDPSERPDTADDRRLPARARQRPGARRRGAARPRRSRRRRRAGR